MALILQDIKILIDIIISALFWRKTRKVNLSESYRSKMESPEVQVNLLNPGRVRLSACLKRLAKFHNSLFLWIYAFYRFFFLIIDFVLYLLFFLHKICHLSIKIRSPVVNPHTIFSPDIFVRWVVKKLLKSRAKMVNWS